MRLARRRIGLRAYLLASLAALALIAVHAYGVGGVVPQTLIATTTAGGLDMALRTTTTDARVIPIGALISGLIVALLLPEGQPWYVPLAAASIAIASKHLLRWRGVNVFNPAAVGITASVLLFSDQLRYGHAHYLEAAPRIHYAQAHLRMDDWSFLLDGGHGWTGSASAIALAILGGVLVHRMRRIGMVAVYLTTYFTLVGGFAVVTGQDLVIRLVLEVFATGVLFFAFIMLTDPVTSPGTVRGRAVYGGLVGLLSFVFRLFVSPVLFLLLALLAANLLLRIVEEPSRPTLRPSELLPGSAATRGR